MAEITRLSGCSDWVEFEFVERERTPSELMRLGIRLHLAGLYFRIPSKNLRSSVSSALGKPFMIGCRKLIYSRSATSPDQIAVDETVIRIDGQQYWLYAAVNPNSNEFLHIRLFPTTTTALTERFL